LASLEEEEGISVVGGFELERLIVKRRASLEKNVDLDAPRSFPHEGEIEKLVFFFDKAEGLIVGSIGSLCKWET
uniref:Acylphosphatase n=1 Tax=Rodentolepis nana TaxID=102285 RepID=A0A0R3TS82_RODNA